MKILKILMQTFQRFKITCKKKTFRRVTKKVIIDFVHSRYGDFVLGLLHEIFDTLALWILPLVFFYFHDFLFF